MKKLMLAIIITSIIEGCSSTRNATTIETIKVANYDYTPKVRSKANNITVALVAPQFAKEMKESSMGALQNFAKSMGADYEELLTTMGYNIRGPFISRGNMVYSDKEKCKIFIEPEIYLSFDISNVRAVTNSNFLSSVLRKNAVSTYGFQGTIVMSGKINLQFCESFTNEKVHVRSIALPQVPINISSSYKDYITTDVSAAYTFGHNSGNGRVEDPGLLNPLIKALEGYYEICFNTSEGSLVYEEIMTYIKDAEIVRKGANYNKF
jgi:hypothetical protein